MAAVISMSFFKVIKARKEFTTQEANICQTTASSAGAIAGMAYNSMQCHSYYNTLIPSIATAGLVGGIPALKLLGYDYPASTLLLWAFSVAYFGVFFALPLRRPLIVKEKLPFPSGIATYETIVAMATAGELAIARGKALLWAGVGAGAFTLVSYFIPQFANPPILQHIGLNSLVNYQWAIDLDPMLFGAGMMRLV